MDPMEKYNQQKSLREKHEQMEIPIELIKIQDIYNKHNIERQHKFNLEIFEKQADLTREINKKQSKLTILSICCAIAATLFGAAVGAYLTYSLQEQPRETRILEQSIIDETPSQPRIAQPTSPPHKEKVLSSEQRARPSTSVSSKPSHNQANAADPKGGAAD